MHLRQGELFLSLIALLCRTALKMKQFLLKAIRFYRKHISPHLPPMCKYYPTCSCYAIEAIETHGAFKGGLLALYRLLRCNPLSAGGYDPVPPKKDKHNNCPHD